MPPGTLAVLAGLTLLALAGCTPGVAQPVRPIWQCGDLFTSSEQTALKHGCVRVNTPTP
jgi:hypothetical protein